MRLVLITILVIIGSPLTGASAQTHSSCEITPLTLPLFDGTPIAETVTPSATPAVKVFTDEEAVEVLEQYVACTNTGDPTLVWAMFTPRWFSSNFANSEEHYLPAFEIEIATGHYPVENPLVLEEIIETELLEDGRIAVTARFRSGASEWTDTLILANVDGQWLIDEVVLVSPPV